MAFVFRDTLICADADATKLVAFSAQVGRVRSITLNGDVYDSSGTLLVCVRAPRVRRGVWCRLRLRFESGE